MTLVALKDSNILYKFLNYFIIQTRHIHVTIAKEAGNQSLSKQGKFMNKFIFGSKKKRKFIFDDTQGSSGNKLSLNEFKYNKENSRRVSVLNVLFMKHISDLLGTGNMGADVVDKGLEISRVSMNPNFNQLNVFWGCNKDENIIYLEKVLPDVSYKLRHELSQLRVMGVVPRIMFIKDKNFTDGAKVDQLLKIADFGEDHELSKMESDFKTHPIAALQSKSLTSEPADGDASPLKGEEEMPPMSHDTLNLDHQLIMNKILKRMKKSRALHRFEPNLAIKSEGNIDSNVQIAEDMTKEERKEALTKFILSRKIIQQKKLKSKYNCDTERYSTQGLDDDDEEDEDLYVEDFIEENFEHEKSKY